MSEDEVKQLIDRSNVLLAQARPGAEQVNEVIARLAGLSPRELVRFDEQSRSWLSGLPWSRVPILRRAPPEEAEKGIRPRFARRRPVSAEPAGPGLALWHVLGLVSADGHERERAVRYAPITILTARLLTVRCIDWVREVRDAALSRLDGCPHEILVEALPLVAQLAAERARGAVLDALLDARLTDDDLRRAGIVDDARTRRVAWQRLELRGVTTPRELRELAAQDKDVLVRAVAARALSRLGDDEQRALAVVLVEDPVGWVAVPALAALVRLDGASAIRPALTARTAAVRRAARDWASIKGVDARSIYLERVAAVTPR